MSEKNPNPLNVNYLVYKVAMSDEYIRGRNKAEHFPGNESLRRRMAIRLAATALKGEQTSGYLDLEGHALNITSQLTNYADNQKKLNLLSEHRASFEEKEPVLLKVAKFNHSIKEMVDANPSLSYNEVLDFLRNMNQSINGREGAQQFEIEAKRVLTGMRHEIAVEQMLWHMPNVEYEDTTLKDDLRGVDIFVSLDGSPLTPIDIKASEHTMDNKKANALYYGYNPDLIVWSHINNTDFGDSFRISDKTAKQQAKPLYDDLKKAVNSYNKLAA